MENPPRTVRDDDGDLWYLRDGKYVEANDLNIGAYESLTYDELAEQFGPLYVENSATPKPADAYFTSAGTIWRRDLDSSVYTCFNAPGTSLTAQQLDEQAGPLVTLDRVRDLLFASPRTVLDAFGVAWRRNEGELYRDPVGREAALSNIAHPFGVYVMPEQDEEDEVHPSRTTIRIACPNCDEPFTVTIAVDDVLGGAGTASPRFVRTGAMHTCATR